MTELTGRTLQNRYRVDSFIGRGGMADVYKVWDQNRAVYLAMKVLHADLAEDRAFLRRFKREADTLAKLQHPHIVRSYGLETDGRIAFILMDYIEGVSLRTRIFDLNRPFTSEEALEIMQPVCAALHYAHQSGIVHCDIKPANIMIHKNGTVLVSDFGISRITEAATATMVGAGTPAYMSPEQARGADLTPLSDIYSLGIVLYEMLSGGERPFTGERAKTTGGTSEKVRWEQINAAPPALRKLNPQVSPALEAVVMCYLQKEPANRPANAVDALNMLVQAVSAKQLIPVESQGLLVRVPVNAVQSPSRLPPLAVMAILFLMLGFGLALGFSAVDLGTRGVGPLAGLATPTYTATRTPRPTITPSSTVTSTPTATFTSTPGIGSTWVSEVDGMVQVFVPEGKFTMGSSIEQVVRDCTRFRHQSCLSSWFQNQSPSHIIEVDAYWIDQTEVTNTMYAVCVQAGICKPPRLYSSSTHENYYGVDEFKDYPVIYVSWYDAKTYCEWAGRHLPTEAQWEKAARGTSAYIYPWGNNSPSCVLSNFSPFNGASCTGDTAQVGKYPNGASSYGTLDMAGNVWEWLADWYDASYYQSSSSVNPLAVCRRNKYITDGNSQTEQLLAEILAKDAQKRVSGHGKAHS
ncbi:MAG: bifunctional serine/threonine-protein kinase/formylglycine-generating enzyme family protein, partial [Anaerolineales bacterium]